MGAANSNVQNLQTVKEALAKPDMQCLQQFVSQPEFKDVINSPINKKGDTCLIYACRHANFEAAKLLIERGCSVNTINKASQTALDIALQTCVPNDGELLHDHFCPFVHTCEAAVPTMPPLVQMLLEKNARSTYLPRLILFAMHQSDFVRKIFVSIPDLQTSPDHWRTRALLLQVCVWFNHLSNLQQLLESGLEITDFWNVSFMPDVVPNPKYKNQEWPQENSGEYTLPTVAEPSSVLELKLSFVQDWRAEWDNGENPSAQFKAALHVTPSSAEMFTRAANSSVILDLIVSDIMYYLPVTCRGPDLNQTNLLKLLALAGYQFTEEMMEHFNLKFGVKFSDILCLIKPPLTLKHMCRLKIRNNLRANVFCSLDKLSLPDMLKSYLCLNTA
jgi:hypothetical protein